MSRDEDDLLAGVRRVIECSGATLGGTLPGSDLGLLVERVLAVCRREVERHATLERWIYLRIPCDAPESRGLIVEQIRPALAHSSGAAEAVRDWWWLHKRDAKGPHLRVRAAMPSAGDPTAEVRLAERLGAVTGRTVTAMVYEPEVALFGGAHGIRLAHELFVLDSHFLAAWFARSSDAGHGKAEVGMSVLLTQHLLRATFLDEFEQWDVWRRVSRTRNLFTPEQLRIDEIRAWASKLIRAEPAHFAALFGPGVSDLIAGHLEALSRFGAALHATYTDGLLECGVRHFLATTLIFHWNRLGYSYLQQSRISASLAAALCPL